MNKLFLVLFLSTSAFAGTSTTAQQISRARQRLFLLEHPEAKEAMKSKREELKQKQKAEREALKRKHKAERDALKVAV